MFKLFKMSWFNSEERKELEKLRAEKKERENQEVLEAIEEKEEFERNLPIELKVAENNALANALAKKPFKSRRIVGDNLIVLLWDGTPLTGSKDLFDAVGEAKSEKEIENLFTITETHSEVVNLAPIIETKEEKQLVKDNWSILKGHSDFLIKGDEVYLKGVSLHLPAIVASSFIEILEKIDSTYGGDRAHISLEEQYQALKMFWLKLAVNPIENSRNQLLAFCKKNDVRITSTGNLVLYRKIVTVGNSDKSLIEFISQQYFKIKKWKKSPKNYFVVEETEVIEKEEEVDNGYYSDNGWSEGDEDDDNYTDYEEQEWIPVLNKKVTKTENKVLKLREKAEIREGDVKGNLEELYLDLPNMTENSYTSQSNKGKYTIKIGEVYKIDESELNVDAGVCHGGGLHAANVSYDYGGYGDTPVVVLVNPSKALTVPHSDMGKLRTTEMFVMCINDKPLGEHYDDYMIYDEQYNEYSIKELETALETKDFSSLCIENRVTEVNLKDLTTITEALKNRIVKI